MRKEQMLSTICCIVVLEHVCRVLVTAIKFSMGASWVQRAKPQVPHVADEFGQRLGFEYIDCLLSGSGELVVAFLNLPCDKIVKTGNRVV